MVVRLTAKPDKDNQTAAQVPFTPAGGLTATNTQAAIIEVNTKADTALTTANAATSANAAQDARMTAIEAVNTTQDANISQNTTDITTATNTNNTQDGRLTTLEAATHPAASIASSDNTIIDGTGNNPATQTFNKKIDPANVAAALVANPAALATLNNAITPTADIYVSGGSFNASNGDLTLTDTNGTTPNVVINIRPNASQVPAANAGNTYLTAGDVESQLNQTDARFGVIAGEQTTQNTAISAIQVVNATQTTDIAALNTGQNSQDMAIGIAQNTANTAQATANGAVAQNLVQDALIDQKWTKGGDAGGTLIGGSNDDDTQINSQGQPTVYLDGETQSVGIGQTAGFSYGTGANNLLVGESIIFSDKVSNSIAAGTNLDIRDSNSNGLSIGSDFDHFTNNSHTIAAGSVKSDFDGNSHFFHFGKGTNSASVHNNSQTTMIGNEIGGSDNVRTNIFADNATESNHNDRFIIGGSSKIMFDKSSGELQLAGSSGAVGDKITSFGGGSQINWGFVNSSSGSVDVATFTTNIPYIIDGMAMWLSPSTGNTATLKTLPTVDSLGNTIKDGTTATIYSGDKTKEILVVDDGTGNIKFNKPLAIPLLENGFTIKYVAGFWRDCAATLDSTAERTILVAPNYLNTTSLSVLSGGIQLYRGDGFGITPMPITDFPTVNPLSLAANGLNGLVTGVATIDTWYNVFAVYNRVTKARGYVFSTQTSYNAPEFAANLPGYDFRRRAWFMVHYTNIGGVPQIRPCRWVGRKMVYHRFSEAEICYDVVRNQTVAGTYPLTPGIIAASTTFTLTIPRTVPAGGAVLDLVIRARGISQALATTRRIFVRESGGAVLTGSVITIESGSQPAREYRLPVALSSGTSLVIQIEQGAEITYIGCEAVEPLQSYLL
jgi:hypothetical protein